MLREQNRPLVHLFGKRPRSNELEIQRTFITDVLLQVWVVRRAESRSSIHQSLGGRIGSKKLTYAVFLSFFTYSQNLELIEIIEFKHHPPRRPPAHRRPHGSKHILII